MTESSAGKIILDLLSGQLSTQELKQDQKRYECKEDEVSGEGIESHNDAPVIAQ